MKSNQSTVFKKIKFYYPMIEEWFYLPDYRSNLKASSNASEEHRIIANAANKYWELIDV